MLTESLRTKPLREWTIADLQLVVGSEESIGLELKSDLQTPKNESGWREKSKLHASEKNDLAKEIVALANAYGGDIIIGIEETKSKPNKAVGLAPKLPDIDNLADALRRSLNGIIDPPISGWELVAIKDQDTDTDGYLVIRIPNSISKPHGYGTPPRTYIRREDSADPMSMRELQDRFYEAQTSRQRIEAEIEKFRFENQDFEPWANSLAASISLVPTFEFHIDEPTAIANEPEVKNLWPVAANQASANLGLSPRDGRWKPNAYGAELSRIYESGSRGYSGIVRLQNNGTINFTGQRLGNPVNHDSDAPHEIIPLWLTVSVKEILAFQHAITTKLKAPKIRWLFSLEILTLGSNIYVRTDPHFPDHEKINLSKSVSPPPIPFTDAYDHDALQSIERKIFDCFGLYENDWGNVIQFKEPT